MKRSLLILLSAIWFNPLYAADAPMPANLEQIESLQKRSDKLVFGEVGSDNYHLAKARAWLDLALSEYHQTDTSGLMFAAIVQAETLITALENKQPDITMDTPNALQGTEVVRTDLWDKVALAKQNLNFKCGQRQLAETEVALVWAGHEKLEAGWSHAESYARSAEDSLYNAQVNMDNCGKDDAKAKELAAAAFAAAGTGDGVGVRNVEKFTLSGDAMFVFGTDQLIAGAAASLDKLADAIKEWTAVKEVKLIGYTDRLRTDGNEAKNQQLSEARAESIKRYLVGKGIAEDKITTSGGGSSKPVVTCSSKVSKAKQVACLQPNRRVEITLRGEK
ncbi:MAG: OmpA family protein [Gallionella sp.]|nr:OmpA family protein [Gallionella sp.]